MLYKLPSLAYEILESISDNETMTQENLVDFLTKDQKDIKYAIRRLQENNLVEAIPDLLDMRIVHYRLPTMGELSDVQNNINPEILDKVLNIVQDGYHTRSTGVKSQAIYKKNDEIKA